MAKPTTIQICAKCSDAFTASLLDENGKYIGEYDGYVPDFMPGDHSGDYVQITIELATGKILDWKRPSAKAIKQTFGI